VAPEDTFEIGDAVTKAACHKCGNVIDVSDKVPFQILRCPHCNAPLAVPAKLGEFLLLKILGKGTMGAAYKAFDRALGRHVAIKVLRKSLGDDKQVVERFLGEARALAALNHRNVVQIYSLGKEKDRPYIVMELVAGGSLRSRIRRDKKMTEAEALRIAVDVTYGLKAAHEIGLIHGDVKPANVLFDGDGKAKLVDFGLARFGGVRQEPGEGLGTPYYVAPERVRQEETDHRGDIYSLGATLFHTLAGEPPFEAETVKDVLLARLKGPARDLRSVRADVNLHTVSVVAKMLACEPGNRYQNYDQLLDDLQEASRACQGGPGVAELADLQKTLAPPPPAAAVVASAPAPPAAVGAKAKTRQQPPKPPKPRKRRNLGVMIALAAGLFLLVVVLVVLLWWMSVKMHKTPRRSGAGEPSQALPDPVFGAATGDGPDGDPGTLPGTEYGPTIPLKAVDATIEGDDAKLQLGPNRNCIGQWRSAGTVVGWDFEVNFPGPFEVEVVYSCDRGHAGGQFTVQVAEQSVAAKVRQTGGWESFTSVRIGRVKLDRMGSYNLLVKGSPKRGKNLMNLRLVRLIPTGS